MAQILPHNRFDDIRYALDPNLGEGAVPDEVILSVGYLPRAERAVRLRDPLADSRTGDEQEMLYIAVIMKTAALLSLVVPQTRQTNMAGHTATFVYSENATERTSRLNAEAEYALDSYLETLDDDVSGAFAFVTTVSGRRG